jgi:DNA (cytosine-5)-methyltransferase 1
MTLDITATDMFCGAGGSTTGAVLAGATVKLAINHWPRAIETHNRNYPNVVHALTDLHKANPRRFPSTTILLASPECTAHSLSKGRKRKGLGQPCLDGFSDGMSDLGAEAEERSRATMWTPLDWAECHDYQAIILENVVDAHLWRPFQSWLSAWKSLDYDFEIVYFNSMHAHPTPQSRDRMYFVAWKRGNRKPNLTITPLAYCGTCEKNVEAVQVWKNPNPDRQHGKYRQQYIYCCPHCVAKEITPYYYAAANAIDWSIPAPRIGDREKPLKEKTMARIAYGLSKFAQRPFTQTGDNGLAMVFPFLVNLEHSTVHPTAILEQPFPTQTTYDATGLTVPPALLLQTSHGACEHASYVDSVNDAPFPTQTTRQDLALAMPPFLLDHLGEYRPRAITGPCSTICGGGNHHSLVMPPAWSWLMTYYNHGRLAQVSESAPTVTTLERHALIAASQQAEERIAVEDCGFRMLVPKEIQAAMAFPDDYILTGTRREQVRQLGNAVTPPVMKLLMERVIASL